MRMTLRPRSLAGAAAAVTAALLAAAAEQAGAIPAFAYVQFSDLAGSGIDLLVGQFQVSDPLFKRELRLEYEDYQPYRVRVGETRADLTYDRGLMAAWSPWDGGDVSLQLVSGRACRRRTRRGLRHGRLEERRRPRLAGGGAAEAGSLRLLRARVGRRREQRDPRFRTRSDAHRGAGARAERAVPAAHRRAAVPVVGRRARQRDRHGLRRARLVTGFMSAF